MGALIFVKMNVLVSTFYFLRNKRPTRLCIFFSPNQWMQEVQKLSARFVCPLIIEQTSCFHLIFSRDNAAHPRARNN